MFDPFWGTSEEQKRKKLGEEPPLDNLGNSIVALFMILAVVYFYLFLVDLFRR